MRRTIVPLMLILALVVSAAPAFSVTTKAGIYFPLSEKAPMPVSMSGRFMTLQAKICSDVGGLGGGQHIHYDAKIKNVSKSTTFYSLHIAFFDKKWNLIAADGFTQIFGQDPGKTDGHVANLYLPQSELGRVAAFQITFYDDTVNIGKQ